MDDGRRWLAAKIESEARAYMSAELALRGRRLGRLQAYVEVGVAFGYWSAKDGRRMANLLEHRWGVRRVISLARGHR